MSADLFELWSNDLPYPDASAMEDLPIVTQVNIERATEGEYHYLHEPSIAWHRGRLYVCWANHRLHEENTANELVRGTVSDDGGMSWQPAQTWVAGPDNDSDGVNHPVIASEQDRLWGFFTRWDDKQPSMEVFTRDDASGAWESTGSKLAGFIPFRAPEKLPSGDWIITGECGWLEPAVALSNGDDLSDWRLVMIPRPADLELRFPEVTILRRGDTLIGVMRPKGTRTAPVAVSHDWGESWSETELSNYPIGSSQPYAGMLSTGQQYLIANHPDEGRTLLSIAVTEPGGSKLVRIWKMRHQTTPVCRLFGGYGSGTHVGKSTAWAYPGVVEHDGKLYVCYSQGKEDCSMSIIPISALRVDA